MRILVVKVCASLALALAWRGAEAIEYGGVAGVQYGRTETWTPEDHQLVPRLQLNGNLSARGYIDSPSTLKWNGSLGYEGIRESYGEADSSSDGLTYRLRLAAFEKRNSAFTVSGSAARTNTDFASSAAGAGTSTGLTKSDSYDLGLTLGGRGRPALSVNGGHRTLTNSGFGRDTADETTDHIGVGFSHGPGAYHVGGNYRGTWNEGSLSLANYVFHSLGLNASTNLSAGTSARLSATHQQRIPGTLEAENPTTESNAFDSSVDWRDRVTFGTVSYGYIHNLLSAPGLQAREFFSHGAGASVERTLSEQWSTGASLGAQFTQARLGTTEQNSAGQSLALLARWTRGLSEKAASLMLEAGPKVGLLEPAGGPVEVGYGASGRGRLIVDRASARYDLDYLVDYESDLAGRKGWFIRQQLQGTAESRVRGDLRLRGSALATGTRQSYEPFGGAASRALMVTGAAVLRDYSLTLELAATDGVQASLARGIQGDGLFFPESYDSSSRSANLRAGAVLNRRLSLIAGVRYAQLSGPGTPSQREAAAVGALGYSLGRFRLTIEDRYVAGGATSFDQRSNVFLVTLARVFGGSL